MACQVTSKNYAEVAKSHRTTTQKIHDFITEFCGCETTLEAITL